MVRSTIGSASWWRPAASLLDVPAFRKFETASRWQHSLISLGDEESSNKPFDTWDSELKSGLKTPEASVEHSYWK
jgi:hypothetical protein